MRKKLMQLLSFIMYIMIIIAIIKIKTFKEEELYTYKPLKIDFNISAESCVVLKQSTLEVLFEKNMNKVLLPASITKILTCLTALRLYPEDDYIYITKEMVKTNGSNMYLKEGDYVKVSTVLYGLMLQSGNDAAKALAVNLSGNENDFISKMNQIAKEIGMKNSVFNNPSGLDDENYNKTTALDMAYLTAFALNNSSFLKYFSTKFIVLKEEENTFYLRHKHRLVQNNDHCIGGKTGYTKKAGRTLVTCFKQNNDIIIIVTMNAYNDWKLHENLFKACFEVKTTNKVLFKNPLLQRLKGNSDD